MHMSKCQLNILEKIFFGIYYSSNDEQAEFRKRYPYAIEGMTVLLFLNVVSFSITMIGGFYPNLFGLWDSFKFKIFASAIVAIILLSLLRYLLKAILPIPRMQKLHLRNTSEDRANSNMVAVIYGAISFLALPAFVVYIYLNA